MTMTERSLPYTKKLVTLAVYDVIETQNGSFGHSGTQGSIVANLCVYGNPGEFTFFITAGQLSTCLCVTLTGPCRHLSHQGESRAVEYLADCVEQTLENELYIAKRKQQEDPQ